MIVGLLSCSRLSSGSSDRSDGEEEGVVIDHALIRMNLRNLSDSSEEDGNSSDEDRLVHVDWSKLVIQLPPSLPPSLSPISQVREL